MKTLQLAAYCSSIIVMVKKPGSLKWIRSIQHWINKKKYANYRLQHIKGRNYCGQLEVNWKIIQWITKQAGVVAFWSFIQEVLVSNSCQSTDNSRLKCFVVSLVPPCPRGSTSTGLRLFPSKSFVIHYSPSVLPSHAIRSRYRERSKINHKAQSKITPSDNRYKT
jgi:hypothetical protein